MQSPQMIQAMQILQLSSLELEERIEQEIAENPFLEVKEAGEAEEGAGDNGAKQAEEGRSVESLLEDLERYERDAPPRTRGSAEEADKKFEAMNNTPAHYHSLGDSLLDQIALSGFDERRRTIAEYLVYSLDARGYLPDTLERLVEASEIPGLTLGELGGVLADLRVATHPALGARDLKECLLLQIEPMGVDTPFLRSLIAEHLEDITTNRLPHVARVTGHPLEDIKQAIETIRMLDPNPGRDYGEFPAETIHPDVVVEELDGRFEVRLTRQGVPDLTVSPAYRDMLNRSGGAEAVRKWIKQRLESARWFIDAVHQRQSTLLRIACAVFERQHGFLDQGIKAMVPLRMLEIADVCGVHISTVSRAVAGKYSQTPHGILPLRFFFSGGTTKASGEQTSQASIKQRIKELIEKESSKDPYSDDALAELLKEKDGITIARRTITKYRKALGIASSNQRRVF
ncbi:MAG: RNA polymerase factor sigma-54 [Planctomycetes bacterium]|nr:RNA polymerase factor sigma-54 [Planctomycetota bacterium]